MNKLGIAIGLVSLASVAHGAAVLQYQWKFDETNATAPSTVPGGGTADLSLVNSSNTATDLHGAPGSGVSGLSGDRALDNSASASMGGNGGLGRAASFTNNTVGVLTDYTITAWVKPTSSITGFGRIFIIGPGGTIDSGGANTIGILTTTNATATGVPSSGAGVGLEINLAGFNRSPTVSLPLDEWTFVAISYEDATDTLRVYRGNTSTPVTLINTITSVTPSAIDLNGAGTTSSVFVGNRDNRARAFDGSIDDVRFYTGLFDSTDAVEAVRGSAVPEPSTLGVLMASIFACGRRMRK